MGLHRQPEAGPALTRGCKGVSSVLKPTWQPKAEATLALVCTLLAAHISAREILLLSYQVELSSLLPTSIC